MNTPGDDAGRTIELPERLAEDVDRRLERTTFETADEYVAFVLEETLARLDTDDDPVDIDESEVRDRLESLGYVDP